MTTFSPNELVLYVDDVVASTKFYSRILGREPLATFDGFAVFGLTGGFALGLQSKHDIQPTPEASFGGFELCVADVDGDAVDSLYDEWVKAGVDIALEPTREVFGYTFVARDLDGHRLRVCATDTTGLS
ncbi:MAG: VOC family protein [Propionibacteriaceae bacterium]|nr:VOC family protein [Propionibacteriaceae bacterium]